MNHLHSMVSTFEENVRILCSPARRVFSYWDDFQLKHQIYGTKLLLLIWLGIKYVIFSPFYLAVWFYRELLKIGIDLRKAPYVISFIVAVACAFAWSLLCAIADEKRGHGPQ